MNERNTLLRVGLLLAYLVSGCASLNHASNASAPESPVQAPTVSEAPTTIQTEDETTLNRLQERVESLEAKLKVMQEQIDFDGQSLDSPTKVTLVQTPISSAGGQPIHNDYTKDQPIQDYREAKILFDSGRFPEASLKFTQFVKKYADHPLAGGSQYYLGRCYSEQKEWELAGAEYKKVIASYQQSSFTSDALMQLIETSQQLNREPETEEYRQKLLTLFPQSPSARLLLEAPEDEKNKDSKPVKSNFDEPPFSSNSFVDVTDA